MHRKPVFIALLIFILLINALPGVAQDDTGPLTHVVQANENLYRIALRYNISVEALIQANGLTNADLVMVGTTSDYPHQREYAGGRRRESRACRPGRILSRPAKR